MGLRSCRGTLGDYEAVRDVSFEVGHGEAYALLGTNGAGKTTILETVQGHRRADGGSVSVLGHPSSDRRRLRSRVGIMLQESGFAGDLTVVETVRLFGALSGRRDEADRLLRHIGLSGKADVRVARLSGGEKRRLDFATAIYGGPEVLFLDEPTTGLDPEARGQVWEVVRQLHDAGTAIVLTTHYLEEAEQYADRIGLLHQGNLVRQGPLAELGSGLPSQISFRLREGRVDLPMSAVTWTGDQVIVETRSLQSDLLELLRWAERTGTDLIDLRAVTPSLNQLVMSLAQGA